jgi:hypothetical protein
MLIAGPGAYICDACVGQCLDALARGGLAPTRARGAADTTFAPRPRRRRRARRVVRSRR